MSDGDYPLIEKHVIIYSEGLERIERSHKEQSRLKPSSFLNYFRLPLSLYSEIQKLFEPYDGKELHIQTCIGVKENGECSPVFFIVDEKGEKLPFPNTKEPAAFNVSALCPPFCDGPK